VINENAQKLVDALRSGEFKQGQSQLRFGDRYCCLGVACELYRRETGDGEWREAHDDGDFVFSLGDERYYLPKAVCEWFGVQFNEGRFKDGSLAGLNDTGESSATIESEPEGLFA
jgi:hypothetical protein